MRINPMILVPLSILPGLILLGVALSIKKPSVSFVDMKTIQAQFIRQLAERKATDSQIALASRQFKQKLKQTLVSFSKNHDAILLEKQTLLSGGKDVTEEIAKALSKVMSKKP